LKQSADDHDNNSYPDRFLPTDLLSEERGSYAAKETSHLINSDNQASNGWARILEGVCKAFRIDDPRIY
jgi:hypothetical protein